MKLNIQKRLAGQVLGCSEKRVRFDTERFEDIKESITKSDIKSLIKDKAIYSLPKQGVSRFRAKKIQTQKSKGKKRGYGSRKGTKGARSNSKREWINKIRAQRILIRSLKDNKVVKNETLKELYKKSQAGFFRSRRHMKLYIEERDLAIKKKE